MNEHIEQAIYEMRANAARYSRTESYYQGQHQLAFASEKFKNTFGTLFREFAMNLCPTVCDAVRDKLVVEGFHVESPDTDAQPEKSAGSVRRTAVKAMEIWRANRMGVRAAELHKEVLKNGDAYIFVWPDMNGQPIIYPNRAASCTVVYDEELPGKILWAAKIWATRDKRVRLNLFYPDRIEKYITAREASFPYPDAKELVTLENPPGHSDIGPWILENPYGVVPVFHFANNADVGSFGQSELEAAIPIQDGLNKSVLDMLVSMEFAAYRQRWAAGIEMKQDADGEPVSPFKAGIDHLWVSNNPDARFGDFENSNLEQFLKVKDSFRIDIASVTGTPLHYLMPFAGGFRSGEAFRKAETRFTAKVRSRQEAFGEVWAAAVSFALRVAGRPPGARLIVEWQDPDQTSEREVLENIRLKKELGIPVEQALSEAGYGSSEAAAWAAEPANK